MIFFITLFQVESKDNNSIDRIRKKNSQAAVFFFKYTKFIIDVKLESG